MTAPEPAPMPSLEQLQDAAGRVAVVASVYGPRRELPPLEGVCDAHLLKALNEAVNAASDALIVLAALSAEHSLRETAREATWQL